MLSHRAHVSQIALELLSHFTCTFGLQSRVCTPRPERVAQWNVLQSVSAETRAQPQPAGLDADSWLIFAADTLVGTAAKLKEWPVSYWSDGRI